MGSIAENKWLTLPTEIWHLIFDRIGRNVVLDGPLQLTCTRMRRLLRSYGKTLYRRLLVDPTFTAFQFQMELESPEAKQRANGPVAVFVGNLARYTNRMQIFSGGGGPQHQWFARGSGIDSLLKYTSTSRLKMFKIRTVPTALATALNLGQRYEYYSIVIVSAPIIGCVGKRSAPTRDKRLNFVFLVNKDHQNYFAWNNDHAVSDVFVTMGAHHRRIRLSRTNQLLGALVADDHGRCRLARTLCKFRLRPYELPRLRLSSLHYLPLELGEGSLVRTQDGNRSMINERRMSKPGALKRRGLAAAIRLSRLAGRAFELLHPGYRAYHGPFHLYGQGDRVVLRRLKRRSDLNELEGSIWTADNQFCEVYLEDGRVVRVHREYVVPLNASKKIETWWPQAHRATDRAHDFYGHLRKMARHTGTPFNESKKWKREIDSDEWRSLIQAMYAEASVVREFDMHYRGFTIVLDLSHRHVVRVQRNQSTISEGVHNLWKKAVTPEFRPPFRKRSPPGPRRLAQKKPKMLSP